MLNPEVTNLCISKNKEESANMTQFMCIWFSFWMFIPPHDNEKHTWHIMMCMCIKFFLLMSPLYCIQGETSQFLQAFKTMSQAAEQEVVQRGFTLSLQGHRMAQFKVYSKTYCRWVHEVYYPMAKLNYDIDYKAFGRLSLNRHSAAVFKSNWCACDSMGFFGLIFYFNA